MEESVFRVCAWAFCHRVPVETDSFLVSSYEGNDPMGSECHLCFYLFTLYFLKHFTYLGFPGGSNGKESACSAGDPGSVSGSARSPGEGNGNPLQYSCLENAMEGGAWWASAPGVARSRTALKGLTCTCSEACAVSVAPRACSGRSGRGLSPQRLLGLWHGPGCPRPVGSSQTGIEAVSPWQADS